MVSYCRHFYFTHSNQSTFISSVSSVFPDTGQIPGVTFCYSFNNVIAGHSLFTCCLPQLFFLKNAFYAISYRLTVWFKWRCAFVGHCSLTWAIASRATTTRWADMQKYWDHTLFILRALKADGSLFREEPRQQQNLPGHWNQFSSDVRTKRGCESAVLSWCRWILIAAVKAQNQVFYCSRHKRTTF